MKEAAKSSPKILKKISNLSTSNIHKEKLHLPSRYVQEKVQNKNEFVNILNSIQTNVKSSQVQKVKYPNSPLKLKNKQVSQQQLQKKDIFEFRSKPIKRQQNDSQNFKDIFIKPYNQKLQAIQQLSKQKALDPTKLASQISKDYQKLLQFQNGLKRKLDPCQQVPQLKDTQVHEHFDEAIRLLESQNFISDQTQQEFYQQQIRIQPPYFPNSSNASSLSPGSGYAPSIPLSQNFNKQSNIKELLIRAKAGMNTQDIEKQAHLSFYLGIVYEQQRNYQSALKFYRRYLGFAKGMEDKIGMTLGANRVAINYFYINDFRKSILFHNENLKLSDNDNCFAGFYNLGICHRRINHFDQALEYFETALQWASQNGQAQSQCISYGQLGVTYKHMNLYQKALENLQKSLELCHKLKKTKLQMKNLMSILLIASETEIYNNDRIETLTYEAYQCTKTLADKRLQQIFSLNIGIMKGKATYQQFLQGQSFQQDFQEYIDSQDLPIQIIQ